MKVTSRFGLLYNSKLSSTDELIEARFPPQLKHCVCASGWFMMSGDVWNNAKSVLSCVNETSGTVVDAKEMLFDSNHSSILFA